MFKYSFSICKQSLLNLSKKHVFLSSVVHQHQHHEYSLRSMSTMPSHQDMMQLYRTNESNPSNHTLQHEAQFYTIPHDVAGKLFLLGGFDEEQQITNKTFRETSIMIRKPALEIIDYLKKTDYSRPINRYVIQGVLGTGKTYTINHLLHFGYNEKFILLFCPKPTDWTIWTEESAVSQFKETRVDTPIDAAVWLQHFKSMNSALLESLDLKTTKKYTWSLREVTEEGEPLKNVLEHGINRIKHASDCVAVLMKELKHHANNGQCKLLVLVDRVNTFYEQGEVLYPDKRTVPVSEITIARAFLKMFKDDWKGGAVVASVCKKYHHPWRRWPGIEKEKKPFDVNDKSDKLYDLLTRQGFEDFDPFIPIKTDIYTEKEIESCLDYYVDRKWIIRQEGKSESGRSEVKFLSGNYPLEVFTICCSL